MLRDVDMGLNTQLIYTHMLYTRTCRHAHALTHTQCSLDSLLSWLENTSVTENLVGPLSRFTTGSLYRCKPMLRVTERWGRHFIHTNEFLCTVDFIFFSNQQSTIYMVRRSRDSYCLIQGDLVDPPLDQMILSSFKGVFLSLLIFSLFALWSLTGWIYYRPCLDHAWPI